MLRYNFPFWTVPVAFVVNIILTSTISFTWREESVDGFAYSYVQPSDGTFSVWGIIYAFNLMYTIYQSLPSVRFEAPVKAARVYMILNFFTNGLWLGVNVAANKGFSHWLAVVVLASNVFALYRAYKCLGVDYSVKACSWARCFMLYLPVSMNSCWVFLASILNASNTLYRNNGAHIPDVGSPDWAIGVFGLAFVVVGWLVLTRLDMGFAFVFIWAMTGVYANNNKHNANAQLSPPSDELMYWALGLAIGTALTVVIAGVAYCSGASSDDAALFPDNDNVDEYDDAQSISMESVSTTKATATGSMMRA